MKTKTVDMIDKSIDGLKTTAKRLWRTAREYPATTPNGLNFRIRLVREKLVETITELDEIKKDIAK